MLSAGDFIVLIALPVQWLSFTAQQKQNAVVLQWATTNEQNTKDFLIQHSVNGINWNLIGTVVASGSNVSVSTYSYEHSAPLFGNNYYRIEQRDMDGRTSYSRVVNILLTNNTSALRIIANPTTKGLLQVQLNKFMELRLYNEKGQLVASPNVQCRYADDTGQRVCKGFLHDNRR